MLQHGGSLNKTNFSGFNRFSFIYKIKITKIKNVKTYKPEILETCNLKPWKHVT